MVLLFFLFAFTFSHPIGLDLISHSSSELNGITDLTTPLLIKVPSQIAPLRQSKANCLSCKSLVSKLNSLNLQFQYQLIPGLNRKETNLVITQMKNAIQQFTEYSKIQDFEAEYFHDYIVDNRSNKQPRIDKAIAKSLANELQHNLDNLKKIGG